VTAVAPNAMLSAAQRAQEDSQQLAGVRVIIVDDESDARELLVATLERRGAEVIAASSVTEALAALANASSSSMPDVLVSDIGMPGEDGFELIKRVRALGLGPGGNIPAIALTAYARAEDREHALEAGFARHLAKPIEPAALASAVAMLVRRAAKA
jgi:CheY-like chemotaxis protein